jgi:hypothetical protein
MRIACCSFETDPVFQASLADERISFGFLRMISGDQVTARLAAALLVMLAALMHAAHTACCLQESKRVKYVFYVFAGASANVMAKVFLPLPPRSHVYPCCA